jgi:hypothetical protein
MMNNEIKKTIRFAWMCDLRINMGGKKNEEQYRNYEFAGSLWQVACDIEDKKFDAKNIKIYTIQLNEPSKEELALLEKTREECQEI